MKDKIRTVDLIKEKREVPGEVRAKLKDFNRIKKMILRALGGKPRTIPEIAEETGLAGSVVTYHLTTLMKFGEIEEDSMDDMDEYYYYRKREKRNGKDRS